MRDLIRVHWLAPKLVKRQIVSCLDESAHSEEGDIVMKDNVIRAAVGALVFAAVWIIISLLLSSGISWVGGVVGAAAWFVTWIVSSQVRRHD